MTKNMIKKLFDIQQELKVPKSQKNTFGNYNFRSCEDIMEASKPICKKYNCVLTCEDKLEQIGDRYYVKATATLYDLDSGEWISTTAYAREEETKRGMDASQITGASSSYARKYALNGLLQLDDNKDADTNEYSKQQKDDEKKKTSPKIEMIEQGQITAIQILFDKIGDDGLKKQMYQKAGISSSKELTKQQATQMIKALQRVEKGKYESN